MKKLILFALGLSAASGLIYEVVVTNILFFYFIESSYSLATVLSVFLFGLGAGSLGIYYLPIKYQRKNLFGFLQLTIGVYAFFVLTNLEKIIQNISTSGTFFTSIILLLVPTICLGASFPLASKLFNKENSVGLIYSADLLGAIIGSLIAGFILIPIYGGKFTIIIGCGLNLLSSFILFSKKLKVIPIVFIIGFLLLFPTNNTNEYDYYSPSPYGLIKVRDETLFINEREQCSTRYGNDASERMMVNYALEPINKTNLEVLNIGLGCGLTVERALDFGAYVDIVEINPKVVEANKILANTLKKDNIHLILDDGLNYLREDIKQYDSVLIDIENPEVAHSSNLYTVEAFKLVAFSLREKGTFALWNYEKLGNNEFKDIIYYSLKEAFPYVYEYPEVFLATFQKINQSEYIPSTEKQLNTIDHKTLKW